MNAKNRKTKKTRYKFGEWEFNCGLCSFPQGELSSCINTVMPINKLKGFLSLNKSINRSKLCISVHSHISLSVEIWANIL